MKVISTLMVLKSICSFIHASQNLSYREGLGFYDVSKKTTELYNIPEQSYLEKSFIKIAFDLPCLSPLSQNLGGRAMESSEINQSIDQALKQYLPQTEMFRETEESPCEQFVLKNMLKCALTDIVLSKHLEARKRNANSFPCQVSQQFSEFLLIKKG